MDLLLQEFNRGLAQSREFLAGALILARTMPMVVLTPFLGGQLIPTEVKMGMGVLIMIIVWPVARGSMVGDIPIEVAPFMLLMLKESFIGFAIGFINSHIFLAMDMAGRLMDTARGTAMSEVQDPHSKKRVTPTGDLLTQLFLIVFVSLGGIHIFLRAYAYSFAALPANGTLAFGPHLETFVTDMMKLTSELWQISLVLSAPVLAATFISDVVFGILNRVAPQLNAYFMSMPVKAFGGVLVLFVAMGAILIRFEHYTVWTLGHVERIIEALGL
jgi:flagellar biosynthetic protein FliR